MPSRHIGMVHRRVCFWLQRCRVQCRRLCTYGLLAGFAARKALTPADKDMCCVMHRLQPPSLDKCMRRRMVGCFIHYQLASCCWCKRVFSCWGSAQAVGATQVSCVADRGLLPCTLAAAFSTLFFSTLMRINSHSACLPRSAVQYMLLCLQARYLIVLHAPCHYCL